MVYIYLKTWVFTHVQPSHPHVSQQHLAASVCNEVPMFGCHRKFQASRVAPVLQLIGQEFHGHLLIMLVGLIQQLHSQLAKIPEETKKAGTSQGYHLNPYLLQQLLDQCYSTLLT